MNKVTITSATAMHIMMPVWNTNEKRSMFQYIASQSLFDPYKEDISDLFVTYTFRDNGFIKELFISDESGNAHKLSNRLTFANGFFKIAV